ncbi:hypothetical protein GCM10007860_23190 [Chitiniphilus shinanonensis]|uniref:Lipoprotein n=1 Tax=Chitiniphilus shinanonensis TaxID=553088 RepID=A0ABQ6BZM1_9NEIS|nr:hypothetical protein [Chitiniphilus shinanonensis]GLS05169.1 hypothetical protein GCM10007860_23190 [Chitiniphilus shinanonensis]
MKRHRWLLLLPGAALAALLFVLVNSAGCNYALQLNHQNLRYHGTCRLGLAEFVETDQLTGSQWTVSAFQLAVADQLLFVVRERRHVREGAAGVAGHPRVQPDYLLVNYAWMPIDDTRVALFQVTPHHDVIVAERRGAIDLMDALWPRPAPPFSVPHNALMP